MTSQKFSADRINLTRNLSALEVGSLSNERNLRPRITERNEDMMDGGMMFGMGIWWLLVLVVLVLVIAALVKYLRK